jgi:hypothetical protein
MTTDSGNRTQERRGWDDIAKEVRVQELRDAVANLRLAERRLWIAVTTARQAGLSWRAVASEVGVAASTLLIQARRPGERIALPRRLKGGISGGSIGVENA